MKDLVWFEASTGDFSAEADFGSDGKIRSIRIGDAVFSGEEMLRLVSADQISLVERETARILGAS